MRRHQKDDKMKDCDDALTELVKLTEELGLYNTEFNNPNQRKTKMDKTTVKTETRYHILNNDAYNITSLATGVCGIQVVAGPYSGPLFDQQHIVSKAEALEAA